MLFFNQQTGVTVMNAICRFMAVAFMAAVCNFLSIGFVHADPVNSTVRLIEYDLRKSAACPMTGCRYVAIPEGWVIPNFAEYPQWLRDAVPSGRGDFMLDYLDSITPESELAWKRTRVTFLGFKVGTPGTTEMRKTMFFPEGYGVNGNEIISHVFFADGECYPSTAPRETCFNILPWIQGAAPQFVDEGFGGWSVIMPTVDFATKRLSCPTGTSFLYKTYNAGFGKPARGLRNDGNHRFIANYALAAAQRSVSGWDQSYPDGAYCVPEEAKELRVSNRQPSLELGPGETGPSWANFHTAFELDVPNGNPTHFQFNGKAFGRIDYDKSRQFSLQGGALRRHKITSSVEEFYRQGIIDLSQVDETTGMSYYLNRSMDGADSNSAELWRDNGNVEPTYKIKLSQATDYIEGQRYESAADMILYTQVFQDPSSGRISHKSFVTAAFWSILRIGGQNTDPRGRIVFIELSEPQPTILGQVELPFAPTQIALDEVEGKVYVVRYADRPFEQVSGIQVVDLASRSLLSFEAWPHEGTPLSVQVDSRMKRLYVGGVHQWTPCSFGSGFCINIRTTFDNVYVKDLTTGQWLRDQNGQTVKIAVGYEPASIAIGGRGGTNFVYVVNQASSAGTGYDGHIENETDYGVHEIDPELLQSVRRFVTEQGPYGLAVGTGTPNLFR